MKAIFTTNYGSPDVLEIREVEKPSPKTDELLIKINAIAVTSGDCRMRSFTPPNFYLGILMRFFLGFNKPRRPIQGLWFAGEIEATGKSVTKFKVGDQIYGRTKDLMFGANAEYICLTESAYLNIKPKNLSFEEAVSIPFGALTAMYFLDKAQLKKNDSILIYGASGAVGSAAVQISKYMEAHVTAVTSTENIGWVKDLGADEVIDYRKNSLLETQSTCDVIFDAVGFLEKETAKKILKKNGKFVSVITSGHAKMDLKKFQQISDLAENGQIFPVIDKCFDFEPMKDAPIYVDRGHKKGNVVVRVKGNG